jgi:hypothetical protein
MECAERGGEVVVEEGNATLVVALGEASGQLIDTKGGRGRDWHRSVLLKHGKGLRHAANISDLQTKKVCNR